MIVELVFHMSVFCMDMLQTGCVSMPRLHDKHVWFSVQCLLVVLGGAFIIKLREYLLFTTS